MSEPSPERETVVSMPLRRYESDILYRNDSYVDAMMNLENYLKSELAGASSAFVSMLRDEGIVPNQKMFEQFPREAIEILRVVPVMVVADYHKALLGAEEYGKWFEQAVSMGTRGHENYHSLRCVELNNEHVLGCSTSARCPLRMIQAKVMRDAKMVYVVGQELENTDDAWADQMDIVETELEIITERRLLSPTFGRMLLDEYIQNQPN